MKIPKRFKLGAITISVEYDDTIVHNHRATGRSDYELSTIKIADKNTVCNIDKEVIEHTFLHEVVHHIMNAMNKPQDEEFTDVFARFMHQYIKSSEFK